MLTSIETRHRFFANAIHRKFNAASIIYARPSYAPARVDDTDLSPEDRAVVNAHFAERSAQEESFFGRDAGFVQSTPLCPVQHLQPGEMNTELTAASFRASGVSIVAVFGTDLIKRPLLSPREWTMVNLHLGLSPYYRGTATNFYPLLNEEPQFVGATIHVLDAGIDSGPILHHARPDIDASDRPHTIGCKAIDAGISAMIDILQRWRDGAPSEGVRQWADPRARIYYRRDYHPRQVVELYKKWDDRFLERCLAKKNTDFPLVHGGVLTGPTDISRLQPESSASTKSY